MKKNSKKLRTLVALAIVAVVAVGFVTNVGIGTMSAPVSYTHLTFLPPIRKYRHRST